MLRVSRRPDTGTLWITGTVRPAGAEQGIRIRRRAGSDNAELAHEEARAIEAEILRAAWHGPRAAVRSFSEATRSYLSHEPRTAATKQLAQALLLHWRDTPLDQITQEAVDRARGVVLRPGAAPATVKRNLVVPLRAILRHAEKRGWCRAPAFDLPREPKGRTAFLLPHQVTALAAAAAPHLRPLIVFLACTGCRVAEALGMDWEEVDLPAARAMLWEGETKSGERRVVGLPPAAIAALAGLPYRSGRVWRTHRGQPYGGKDGENRLALRGAWHRACREAGLPGERYTWTSPKGKVEVKMFRPAHSPHVLRHTWATWHYALNRDLLLLARDGGWASTVLVARYAHLMPSGHEAAIRAVWGWHGSPPEAHSMTGTR